MPITNNSELSSPSALMDERSLSCLLGVSVRTVQAWRVKGGGPVFLKFNNRLVRYRKADVEAWLEALAMPHTSAAGVL